jgi:hypothetical protein
MESAAKTPPAPEAVSPTPGTVARTKYRMRYICGIQPKPNVACAFVAMVAVAMEHDANSRTPPAVLSFQ